MRRAMKLLIYLASFSTPTMSALAQWRPAGGILDVTVTNRCAMTAGKVASAKSNRIFFCPSRAAQVDGQVPDASHFYLVHEYGLLAVHTTSEKLADCWAAHTLAAAPNGRHYVRQWIKHWRTYGRTSFTYGSPEQRISNVRSCCACGV